MTREHAVAALLSSPAGIAPLDVWIAIKVVLRRELGEREWEMWIKHARLWCAQYEGEKDQTLAVLMPRNGRAITGANRYYKRVRQLGAKLMYGVLIMPWINMEDFHLKREAIEAMPVSDLSDDELREMRFEVFDRRKVPEQFPEWFRRQESVDELLRQWPVSHQRKAELLERWEWQNEFLSQPFLEPPCSPLWEGFHG